MNDREIDGLIARIEKLEARLRDRQRVLFVVGAVGLVCIAGGLVAGSKQAGSSVKAGVVDEVRTRRLVVVDDQDRMRVEIAQDAPGVERYSRSAGLTIFDADGRERGGIATSDDGSAVVALDAPWGVGSPMRDRAGMKVDASGSALMGVLSNRGAFAAILSAEGDDARLDLYQPDDEAGRFKVKALRQSGESQRTEPMSNQHKAATNDAK